MRNRREPSKCVSCVQSVDSNRRPRSVVIVDGVPNQEIHPLMHQIRLLSVSHRNGLWPAYEPVDAGKDVCKTSGR